MALRRLILFSFLVLFSPIAHTSAGGWPQPKGGYYIKMSEWWVVSDQHFDTDGLVVPNIVEYGYYSTALYGEYGISRKLTGILYLPLMNYTYFVLPTSLDRQGIWKIGDTDFGLKYALTFEKPTAISASLILGLPSGYHKSGPLQTGDGEFNQVLRLDAGRGFTVSNVKGWLNIYAGYNHRTNSFADELHYGAETGISISKDKVSVILRLDRVDALDNAVHAQINPQSLFSNFKDYLSLSPEIGYHITPAWGITVGAGTALSGKNIFASPSFTLGIFYKKIPQTKEKAPGI